MIKHESAPQQVRQDDRTFQSRWIAANALAEAVGLGGSALVAFAFLVQWEATWGVIWSAAAVVLLSTLCEGTAVGIAQWSVLRGRLPALRPAAWWASTALGAGVAWTLGMVPSTLMAMGEANADAAAAPMAEPSTLVVYALAAGMGLVLGPVLATPQWWVLRRFVDRAWRWIPANSLAWAVGMVAIFAGVGFAADSGAPVAVIVPVVIMTLLFAGAAVGAIHGAFLVRMLAET
ncbi:MAG: hypothetical protein KDD83_12300 [Caldilineaceae bacterium]|nr:hypothetical protein [Caldilineaceae bacterium]